MFKFNVLFRDNIVINIEINNKKSPILHFENCDRNEAAYIVYLVGAGLVSDPKQKS